MSIERDRKCYIATRIKLQSLVQITDPDYQAGFEEAQEPYYADCGIRTDMGLVEVIRAMLTEVVVEMGLSESYDAAQALLLEY